MDDEIMKSAHAGALHTSPFAMSPVPALAAVPAQPEELPEPSDVAPPKSSGSYQRLVPIADLEGRVRSVVRALIGEGEVSSARVAERLHRSERTLRRQLGERGTTYQQLLDDTRRELALQYLQGADKTVSQIGTLLCFSETASFYRAFRRWTGKSVAAFRVPAAAE